MPNNPKPYLWGKKFCHHPDPKVTQPICISGRAETLCGTPMLGNNYANQETDSATCPTCLKIFFK